MCCYQSDVTRVTSSLALVKISRKNMPTWNSAGIFNWDSNWCQFCWMKFEAWHVFSGLETANSLMVRCGRGVRRPSTQVVTMEGLQKCAKHRGPAIRTPFAKSKTFSGSGIPCVYYIYIHNYNYIYIYYLCRSVFFFFSGLHQWASMMLTSEWNCSCRTICNRIKLCSSEEFPFEAMKAMYPSFASETMVKTVGFMIRAMKNTTIITSHYTGW